MKSLIQKKVCPARLIPDYKSSSTHRTSVETFFLFSHEIPSSNLGFIDPKATDLSLTLAGRDFTIHQSPTVLSSTRAGGTTGAGESLYSNDPNKPSSPFILGAVLQILV